MKEGFSFNNLFAPKPKNENDIKLAAARTDVEKLADKLGMPIDKGIKETVAVLRAMGLPTISSCAGHIKGLHEEGYGYPYVGIYAPAPKGWENDKQNPVLRDLWKEANMAELAKIKPLLDEFNRSRPATDAPLEITPIGLFGGFTIESRGKRLDIKTEEELRKYIAASQKEMGAFTDFIGKKFKS